MQENKVLALLWFLLSVISLIFVLTLLFTEVRYMVFPLLSMPLLLFFVGLQRTQKFKTSDSKFTGRILLCGVLAGSATAFSGLY